jgi:hypothetical protein
MSPFRIWLEGHESAHCHYSMLVFEKGSISLGTFLALDKYLMRSTDVGYMSLDFCAGDSLFKSRA